MKNFVTDSSILNKIEISCANRDYAEYEIAGNIDFEPGQYLMLRTKNHETTWPYPYFLIRKTEHGVTVLAEKRQELYKCRAGDTVQFWGPRGTSPIKKGGLPILAAEPATCFLLYPFLSAGLCQKLFILDLYGGFIAQKEEFSVSHILNFSDMAYGKKSMDCPVSCYTDISQAAEAILEERHRIITALNPQSAALFAEHIPDDRKVSFFLYISNKKACGIDGCKGCYLHDRDGGMGINVCCKGPFMPLSIIDFEKDGKSLEEFI